MLQASSTLTVPPGSSHTMEQGGEGVPSHTTLRHMAPGTAVQGGAARHGSGAGQVTWRSGVQARPSATRTGGRSWGSWGATPPPLVGEEGSVATHGPGGASTWGVRELTLSSGTPGNPVVKHVLGSWHRAWSAY